MATSQELFQQRNDLQSQLNASLAPVASGDYSRYLTDKVDGFKPLIEERRGLEAQANNALPSMIQQYTQQRQADPGNSASPMTALNNIFNTQNQTRGTANVLGDLLNGYQGRLGNISQDAMSMVGQRQKQLGNEFDISNQDYSRQLQFEERERERALAEKLRQEAKEDARRASAASRAAMMSAYGGGGGGYGQSAGGGYAGGAGGSIEIDNQPSTANRISSLTGLDNPGQRIGEIMQGGEAIFDALDPSGQGRQTVSNIFQPSNDFINNLTGGNLYKGLTNLGFM